MAEHEPTSMTGADALWTLEGDGPAERLEQAAFDAQIASALALHQAGGATKARTARGRGGRMLLWSGAAALALGSAAAAFWLGSPRVHEGAAGTGAGAVPRSSTGAPAPEGSAAGPAEPTEAATGASASDLLARANRLRAQGEYRAALELYLRAGDDANDLLSAHVALVAAGDLALQALHEPTRARQLYTRARQAHPTGPLLEEALLGIAASHRAEGRLDEERRALEALVGDGASGPAAARARQRLGELRGRE